MKTKIERYLRKKKRQAALKLLKDNILIVLGALGIIILLVVLKVLKRKAQKKVKAKIKSSIKEGMSSIRNTGESSDGEKAETEE